MSTPRLILLPPGGASLQWTLFVYQADRPEHGHLEGDYVIGDFGDLVQLEHRQGFPAGGLHEYDDDAMWAYWPEDTLKACGQHRPEPAKVPRPLRPDEVRVLAKFERTLEKWELPHLRALAASQAEQIEALQAQLDAMSRRCYDAESSLDFWHDHAMELGDALHESDAGQIGLTRSGQLLVLPPQNTAQPS